MLLERAPAQRGHALPRALKDSRRKEFSVFADNTRRVLSEQLNVYNAGVAYSTSLHGRGGGGHRFAERGSKAAQGLGLGKASSIAALINLTLSREDKGRKVCKSKPCRDISI